MEKFEDCIEQMMIDRGMPRINDKVNVRIERADEILYKAAVWYFGRIGKEFKPIPEYREVSNWLENNNGKGLFLFGNHGRGKTVLAKYIIPAVLLYYQNLVCRYYKSTELGKHIDEALQKKIIVVDDIGVESQSVEYGNRRNVMDEIMDSVEQGGKLVIITTNLTKEMLIEKYGHGVYDRIVETTVRIPFIGESFRE